MQISSMSGQVTLPSPLRSITFMQLSISPRVGWKLRLNDLQASTIMGTVSTLSMTPLRSLSYISKSLRATILACSSSDIPGEPIRQSISNQYIMLDQLPHYILVRILIFLPLKQIVMHLRLVSKKLSNVTSSGIIQAGFCQQFHPSVISPEAMELVFRSIVKMKNDEIPFWGVRTNSGVTGNSLRFWIGKSFMRTLDPQVGLKKFENSFIEGHLAQVQRDFKQNLCKAASCLMEGEEAPIEEVEIYDLYSALYGFPYNLQLDQENYVSIAYLFSYSTKMSEMIYRLLEDDPYIMNDDINPIMENVMALPRYLRISRKAEEFNRIAKTLFIFTSRLPEFPAQFEPQAYKCTSEAELSHFLKNRPVYEINRSNIPDLLQPGQQQEKEKHSIQDFSFCTFAQTNQTDYQPLIWIKFNNPQTKEFEIPLRGRDIRYCKSVHLKILDLDLQPDAFLNGAALSYVSLSGQLLNEKTLEFQ